MRSLDRRADARRKIQFGGLVIKAGLSEESASVLLGLLLDSAVALKGPSGQTLRARFQKIGDRAFSEKSESSKPQK
jgi:hypothetical protein